MKLLRSFLVASFWILALILFAGYAPTIHADKASGFIIEIQKADNIPINTPIDMTIKAVDAQGNVVKDYTGIVIMGFDNDFAMDNFDFPSNSFYMFTVSDQGSKTFSKGFTAKKSGSFTLKFFEGSDETIVGTLPITVRGLEPVLQDGQQIIDIQEPTVNADITASALQIIGLTDSRKTPLEIYIDQQKQEIQAETDDSGAFSLYLTDLTGGDHTLQVKLLDFEGKVIGLSAEIPFSYTQPRTDNFLIDFTAEPHGAVSVWDTIQFSAKVDPTVRSIEIKPGTLGAVVMDRVSDGIFSKSLVVSKSGTHKVDVTLVFEGGQRMAYPDRATLDIKAQPVGVGILKVVNDAADPAKVMLSWEPKWAPQKYLVRYGTAQDKLTSELEVTATQIQVSWLELGKQYFFQVAAVDEQGQIGTTLSDIAMITTKGQQVATVEEAIPTTESQHTAPSCTVVGLEVRTEKIGDQYYLVWDTVAGATEYHIYKSDYNVSSIAHMQKIATTTVPQFSYPFNPQAKQNEYTYYSVVATCSDGQNLQIDSVKKVQTWPVSDMILLFFISLMAYLLFRVYRYNY